MLPETKRLIEVLSQDDSDCKFYNNDEDTDLEEVLKEVFGEELPKPRPLRCSDGKIRTFTFEE